MAVFVDPRTGQVYANVPDEEAERARGEYGLVPQEEWQQQKAGDAADTKGALGNIGEGFQRGLGHIQDAARAGGWTPPMPGSEAFGPGAAPLTPPQAPAPLPPSGAETFPEANSPEARIRAERHPFYQGLGTGLAVAPASALAGAAAGALGGPAIFGAAAGGIAAEQAVEAVAQEYDDAWLEQRPFELTRAAGYLAMFGIGDVLLRGGGKVAGKALGEIMAPTSVQKLGTRNAVAEAQAKAEKAGARPATRSVGAASAAEMNDPFDEALGQMSEADAYVLSRDFDDHSYLVATDIADEMTRLNNGLSESLGNNLKYRDFEIAADAWDGSMLERQSEWVQQAEDMAGAVIEAIEQSPVDLGNHGKRVAADLRTGWTNVAAAESPARRLYLLDNLKKTLDKRITAIAGDFQGDPVARTDLLKLLDEYVGGADTRGFLREGLENVEHFGHAAELQKALNSPWHDMLKSWRKVSDAFLEATGETRFGVMGAGRNVMQGTVDRARAVIGQDQRSLGGIREALGNVFDGYQRLIEARQAHGIVEKEGLPQLEQSIRNLMEDWNLGATLSTAKAKAAHIQRNPRHWRRILEAAEGTPGIGGFLKGARQLSQITGDLHIQKGTALANVWDEALRRYAQHPNLAEAPIYANYSPWMQEALRARGARIPGPPEGTGGLGKAVAGAAGNAVREHGSKVAGAGLIGLGAQQAATQKPKTDEHGQPIRGADLGAGGAILTGLTMLLGGKGALRRFQFRAARRAERFTHELAPAKPVIEQAIDSWKGHAGLLRWAKNAEDKDAIERAVTAAATEIADRALQEPAAQRLAQHGYEIHSEFKRYAEERILERMARESSDILEQKRPGKLRPFVARGLQHDKPPPRGHALDEFFDHQRYEMATDEVWELASMASDAEASRMIPDGLSAEETNRLVYMLDDKVADIHSAVRKAVEASAPKLSGVKGFADGERLLAQAQTAAEELAEKAYGRALPHEWRQFIEKATEAQLTHKARDIVDAAATEYGSSRRLRGGGIRLRSLAKDVDEEWAISVRNAHKKRDAKQLARLKESVERRLGDDDGGLPPEQRHAVARELMDAALNGEKMVDALHDIARVTDGNAEDLPLGLDNYKDLSERFERWASDAETDLGVDVNEAIANYTGNLDYKKINMFARDGAEGLEKALVEDWGAEGAHAARDNTGEIAQKAINLQAALDYAADQGMTAPGRTWRGIRVTPEELGKLEEAADANGLIEAYGFMSTSANPKYPGQFIQKRHKLDDGKTPIVFEVIQKTGVPVNAREAEVLLRAGSKFKLERGRDPVSGAQFVARELDGESTNPHDLAKGSAKYFPWIAGGILGVGATLDSRRASAADLPPDARAQDRPPPPAEAGPASLYREAVRGIDEGGANVLRQKASAALRRVPPRGRTPLRAFTGSRDLDAAVDATRETLAELQADPSALIDTLANNLGDLPRTHPSVYMALTEKAVGIVSYLSAQVPARTGQTMLDPVGTPPSTDRSLDFAYKVVGATNPEQAMGDIARLDIPPEELEAFQANWPELWEPYKAEILGQTIRRTEGGRPVDGEKLRALDAILGMNGALDPSGSVEVAQHLLAAQEQSPAAPASNSPPTSAPSPSGRAAGMFRTRLEGVQMEQQVG